MVLPTMPLGSPCCSLSEMETHVFQDRVQGHHSTISPSLIMNLGGKDCCYPSFTGDGTEAINLPKLRAVSCHDAEETVKPEL